MKNKGFKQILAMFLTFALVFGIMGEGFFTITTEAALSTTGGGAINGVYYIRNRNSFLFLDVHNSGTSSGTVVKQWSFNGKPAQRWQIHDEGDGHSLRPMHATGLRLHVESTWSNGKQAEVRTSNGSTHQRFRLPVANGGTMPTSGDNRTSTRQITKRDDTSRVVDVPSGSTAGDKVQISQQANLPRQQWEIIPAWKVTFDLNGGTSTTPAERFIPHQYTVSAVELLPVPTRANHRFVGWYTKKPEVHQLITPR